MKLPGLGGMASHAIVALLLTTVIGVRAGVGVASESETDAETQEARLLLSRATYGPRPGDLERVLAQGADAWLEEQLNPERIDDSRVEKALAPFDHLAMSTSELMERYPRPSREEREAMQERREQMEGGEMGREEMRRMRRQGPGLVLAQLSHAKLVRAVESERQLAEVMTDFWFNHFNVYARKNRNTTLALPSYERDAIRPHVFGRFEDLLLATAQHPAMLFYLDNWISTKEGFDPREALLAAMPQRRRGGSGGRRPAPQGNGQQRRTFGLNENYGRELLELHTVGVEGGYDQADVVAAARALTGWSVVGPQLVRLKERVEGRVGPGRVPPSLSALPSEGSFYFNGLAHDQEAKTVLGQRFDSGGLRDGVELIRYLARHPSTARVISRKLAVRFVSDTPSEALVDELAQSYLGSGGDIRTVLLALFRSPRFVAEASQGAKVKTPLELVASALRATSADVEGRGAARHLQELGMPLYLCQPPTGYDEEAATWLSAGNVLTRLRFIGGLVTGRLPGLGRPEPPEDIEGWAREVLVTPGADLSAEDEATLAEALGEFPQLSQSESLQRMALVLASPAFQRQ